MIAQRILSFWARSKTQCILEIGKEEREFDEVALTPSIAKL